MATVDIPLSLTVPDASGNAYPLLIASTLRGVFPAFVKDVDGFWYGTFHVPQNYSSGPKVIVRVGANSTAGQVTSFIVGTKAVGTGATWDAAYTAETVQDLTLQTTAYRPSDITFTLSTTPVAGAELSFYIEHNGSRGADTLAVDTILFDAWFQYTSS